MNPSLPRLAAAAPSVFTQRMKEAIDQSSVEGVLAALADYCAFPDRVNGRLLCLAARKKHPAILDALLNASKRKAKLSAAKTLFAKDDEASMMALAGADERQVVVHQLMRCVVITDNVNLMKTLVENFGQQIALEGSLKLLLTEAANHQQWNMFRYLDSVTPQALMKQQASTLLYYLVRSPTAPADLVEKLLDGKVEKADSGWRELLMHAATYGCTTSMRALVDTGMVEPKALVDAIAEASVNGHDEAMATLIALVSVEDLAEGFSYEMKKASISNNNGYRIEVLKRALDQTGTHLKPAELTDWVARFHQEPLPMSQAYLRVLRTIDQDEVGGGVPDEPRRARARP